MNTSEMKAERIRQKKSIEYISNVIKKSHDTYAKKERGIVKFSPNEIVVVSNDLHLTFEQFNDVFFDSKLPFGK